MLLPLTLCVTYIVIHKHIIHVIVIYVMTLVAGNFNLEEALKVDLKQLDRLFKTDKRLFAMILSFKQRV